jgi:hypothetical protein
MPAPLELHAGTEGGTPGPNLEITHSWQVRLGPPNFTKSSCLKSTKSNLRVRLAGQVRSPFYLYQVVLIAKLSTVDKKDKALLAG